jgi:hypothetical protein
MKISRQTTPWLVGALIFLTTSTGAFAQGGLASVASLHDPGPETAPPEADFTAEVLASFRLSNGGTVKLLAVPELGELGYVEIVQAGAEPVLPGDGAMGPLEVFLALAPLEAPIPRALIDLDTHGDAEHLAAGRARTERLSEPMAVAISDLDLPAQGLAASYCGSGGGSLFAIDQCRSFSGHNCNLIDFCDASYNGGDTVWFSLTRSSYSGGWLTRQSSYGRTAACGTSVEIKQQYWVSGAWSTLSTQTMQSGQLYVSSWHGPQAYRRIVRKRLTSSGGFRAYTNFHNDC